MKLTGTEPEIPAFRAGAAESFGSFTRMKKPALSYESHLMLREFSLSPGGEWLPHLPGWILIQINSGTGYWLQAQSSTELEAGMVLLVAEGATGHIRASLLNGLSLHYFNVIPARLISLITLGEQSQLKRATTRPELAWQMLPASDPMAVKMAGLCAGRNRDALPARLSLLQLVAEMLGKELEQPVPDLKVEPDDARERLRKFLAETPPDALLEISFHELAQATGCTARHLSRIFFNLVGMSFRDKRAEIRLARARELLATSQTKVVEVALESGYKSLSFFNLVFTRRFGVSPGRWRQKNGGSNGGENYRLPRIRQLSKMR